MVYLLNGLEYFNGSGISPNGNSPKLFMIGSFENCMVGVLVSTLYKVKTIRFQPHVFKGKHDQNDNLLCLFINGSKISIITEVSGGDDHSLNWNKMD